MPDDLRRVVEALRESWPDLTAPEREVFEAMVKALCPRAGIAAMVAAACGEPDKG